MEAELRTIMNQNEQKMASVNWKEFPTPKIPKTQSLPKSTSAPALVPMVDISSCRLSKPIELIMYPSLVVV